MRCDATPAIRGRWQSEDGNAEVLRVPDNSVSFHRGMGDSGRKVEVVEHECPFCAFDRMVRLHYVNPESRDRAEYYCLNPGCPHFVMDDLSFAQSIRASKPMIWSQSARCPECDEAHTIEVAREFADEYDTVENDNGFTEYVALCDDCQVDRVERRADV